MADTPTLIARVIDFETIGVEPDPDAIGICEVGYTDLYESNPPGGPPVIGAPVSSLCQPGVEIPVTAMAIHHITDAMVAEAPTGASILRESLEPDVVKVAHNAKFERSFCDPIFPMHKWICTQKVAHRLWPHAPGFSNHALRYWLGLNLDPGLCMPPHRAGPDSYVTAGLLARMLMEGVTVDEMIEWTSQPILLMTINFGKHFGKRWDEVEEGYLRWIVNKLQDEPDAFDEDVAHTARHYLRIATSGETP